MKLRKGIFVIFIVHVACGLWSVVSCTRGKIIFAIRILIKNKTRKASSLKDIKNHCLSFEISKYKMLCILAC